MRIRIHVTALVMCSLIAFAQFCMQSCARERSVQLDETKVKVIPFVLTEKELAKTVSGFGAITFSRKIDIYSVVDGTVKKLFVREGQKVRQGEDLAILANIQLELRQNQASSGIDSARASLDLAKARLWEAQLGIEAKLIQLQKLEMSLQQKKVELEDAERVLVNKEELFKAGGITDDAITAMRIKVTSQQNEYAIGVKELELQKIGLRDVDLSRNGFPTNLDAEARTRAIIELNTKTAKAECDVGAARLYQATRDFDASCELIKQLTIKAPVDGIVGAKYVEVGELVQQNGKTMTLIDTTKVYAALSVQESEIPLLREGLKAQIVVEALASAPLAGIVENISPAADPQTGAFLVKVQIPNFGNQLKPGMFARGEITYSKPTKVILLPDSCIVQKRGSIASVFTVVNNKAFSKEVRLGKNTLEGFIIEEGLSKGNIVIDTAPPTLKEGMDVEIAH